MRHSGIHRLALAGSLVATALLAGPAVQAQDIDRTPHDSGLFDRGSLDARAVEIIAVREGYDPDDLSIVNRAHAQYDRLDKRTIVYKITDAVEDGLHAVAIDLDGREVDPEQLEAAEAAAYAAEFGKLGENLAALLPNLGEGETVPVAIRVHGEGFQSLEKPSPDDQLDREEIRAIADAQRESRRIFVAATLQPVTAVIGMLGAQGIAHELSTLISAELDAAQIEAIAGLPMVERIELELIGAPEMDVSLPTITADRVHDAGFTGNGVKIAQVESLGGRVGTGASCLSDVTQNTAMSCWTGTHARHVALILQSPCPIGLGVAYGADLWAGGSCSGASSQLLSQSDRAASWGASALNLSWGACNGGEFTDLERFYDELAYYDWLTIVKSAGNQSTCGGSYVSSPGNAYNVFTVGNFDDKGTVDISDDAIAAGSCYKNPDSRHDDRLKPEVAAPGTNITVSPDGGGTFLTSSGTSFAAPHVTGAAALLMEREPSLEVWHESVRALLMATAWNNVSGSATSLDNRDGAGGIRTKRAYNVLTGERGDWGGRSYSCSSASHLTIDTMYLRAGDRTRVVVVWDQNPTYSNYKHKPSADLDLRILSPGGATVASSHRYDNTYEFVDFTPSTSGTYTIKVDQYRCSKTPSYIGWAWYQAP